MPRNGWKPGKMNRTSTSNSEIARMIFFSLVLAVLFQIPLAAFQSKVCSHSGGSFFRSVTPEAGALFQKAAEFNPLEQKNVVIQQRAYQPTSIPHYAFVKFSSYRISLKTFFVIGLSSVAVRNGDRRQIVHSCEWHPSNGSHTNEMHTDPKDFVVANASMLYVRFDENGMTYAPAIVNCTFVEDVGADGNGGLLVIKVSLTIHRFKSNVPAIVLDEQKGDVESITSPLTKANRLLMIGYQTFQKPHKYAYCGAPMYGSVNAEWVRAWLVYHNHLSNGDALFFFYNIGGLKDEDRHIFNDFIDAGLLNITDLTNPLYQSMFPVHYYHQVLFSNDCFHRARLLADYVLYLDFDEFLQIRSPETIGSLVDKHKDRPWVSFGSFPADFGHCTPPASGLQYPVERMQWHDKLPECIHKDVDRWKCHAHIGRRKWVANTKFTVIGGVHRASIPLEGGIIMNASEARVIHFHGVLNPRNTLCNQLVEEKDYGRVGKERNLGISIEFAQAKLFPIKRKEVGAGRR